jgi:hypothetical protein
MRAEFLKQDHRQEAGSEQAARRLAELGEAIAAACRARAWRPNNDALAREMLGQGFARRSFTREHSDTRAGSGEARKRLVPRWPMPPAPRTLAQAGRSAGRLEKPLAPSGLS